MIWKNCWDSDSTCARIFYFEIFGYVNLDSGVGFASITFDSSFQK